MAARLRSAVGFYNGGGVTPVPTPVPTTDLATYREIEWNGSAVKALCDVYGRLFTRYDSANNFYNGVAWTDEGLDKTFDSIEGHEEAFMALIGTYGHNDAVTGEGVDNVVINLDGTSTEFTFEDGQCVPVPSLWQQGTVKTLFYRSLNDGTNNIIVLCDTDGKLVVGDGAEPSYLEYMLATDQIGLRTANRDALIAAAGGSVAADVYSDNDGNYILVSLDGYTVVADLDGIIALGDVPIWSSQLTARVFNAGTYLCDAYGKALRIAGEPDNVQSFKVGRASANSLYSFEEMEGQMFLPEDDYVLINGVLDRTTWLCQFNIGGQAYKISWGMEYSAAFLVPNNIIEYHTA